MKSSLSSLLFSMLLNMLLNMLLTMLLISNLTACSGGGGDGGGNGTGNGPQSKEEALQKLSPTHKANFDTWLSKVVKTCEASQAFGLKQDRQMQQEGVDGAALLKKNNGSVVFSDGKSLAILTGYNSISGVGSTKFEETSDLNGQTYSITAETKREGSNCTVYLYGQKVYETTFVESFTIGTQYSPNQQATSTSQIPTIRNLGPNGSEPKRKFFNELNPTR